MAAPLKAARLAAITLVYMPPVPTLLPAPQADDETKARRKAAKERKQAEARARREQQLKARGR